MKETSIKKYGKTIVAVRSDAGKLMFVKTTEGYEMKCPRSKQTCLIRYEEMFSDCMRYWKDYPQKTSFLIPAEQ